MGAHNISVVDIDFAFVAPDYKHIVVAGIPDKHVLGEKILGKVGIPVGEDLGKAGTLSMVAVGKEELDMVYVVVPVVVAAEYFVQNVLRRYLILRIDILSRYILSRYVLSRYILRRDIR